MILCIFPKHEASKLCDSEDWWDESVAYEMMGRQVETEMVRAYFHVNVTLQDWRIRL